MLFLTILSILLSFSVLVAGQIRNALPMAIRVRRMHRDHENISFSQYSKLMNIYPVSYLDLMERSYILFDNTLFLRSFLVDRNKVMFAMFPNGFGKSVNMFMLKCFLSMTLDNEGVPRAPVTTREFKFFQHGFVISNNMKSHFNLPPLISKNDPLMASYFKKTPVISVNFPKIFNVTDLASTMEYFRNAISKTFKAHTYLHEKFKRERPEMNRERAEGGLLDTFMKTFTQYEKMEEIKEPELIASVQFLSEFLRKMFLTDAVIIIDDYDKLLKHIYFETDMEEDELLKFFNLYKKFMAETFASNKFARHGAVSGELRTTCIDFIPFMKNAASFFGFDKPEIQKLIQLLELPKEYLELLEKWYGQYYFHIGTHNSFNPGSIVQFINEQRFQTYWEVFHNTKFLLNVMKCKQLRDVFERLLFGYYLTINYIDDFTFSHKRLLTVRKFYKGIMTNCNHEEMNMMIFYLLATGYLTHNDDRKSRALQRPHFNIRIPNREIENVIVSKMCQFYADNLNDSIVNLTQQTAAALLHTMEYDLDNSSVANLEANFTKLFVPLAVEGKVDTNNMLHEIILFLALTINSQSNYTLVKNRSVAYDYVSYSSSIFFSNIMDNVIVELKFIFSTMNESSLHPTSKDLHWQINNKTQYSKFIGVTVASDGQSRVLHEMH